MDYPNWFEYTAKDNFEYLLSDYAGKPDLRFLQIGTFTGDASLWLLENILTHPTSRLVDIDTWEGSEEDVHKSMDFKDVFTTYLDKTKEHASRRLYHIGTSQSFFMGSLHGSKYDFIYVDGDHTAAGVISDATMAMAMLKPGGILAFDDYTWTADSGLKVDTPNPAINFFFWANEQYLEPLRVNAQFWVRKK